MKCPHCDNGLIETAVREEAEIITGDGPNGGFRYWKRCKAHHPSLTESLHGNCPHCGAALSSSWVIQCSACGRRL